MISWLFIYFFIRSLFVGNHDHKKNKKKIVKQVGEGIILLLYTE